MLSRRPCDVLWTKRTLKAPRETDASMTEARTCRSRLVSSSGAAVVWGGRCTVGRATGLAYRSKQLEQARPRATAYRETGDVLISGSLWTCCKRALHRTREFLTKSHEHRAVPPRRPTFSFRPLAPVHTDGAGRGTSVCPNRARIAQDLGSPGGTDCATGWEIGIRRCCQESIEWTG